MTLGRAAAVFVFLAVAIPYAIADPPCSCPRVQALAANLQMGINQTDQRFNLAILPDGSVRCWGSACPIFFPPPRNVAAVAAGFDHALVLYTDGTLQQFKGSSSTMPPPSALLKDVTAIAAGMYHGLALRRDGSIVAWGTSANPNLTVPPNAKNVTAIAAGSGHSLALRKDGRVIQWPGAVPQKAMSGVVAIAAGVGSSLAAMKDGSVIEWDSGSGSVDSSTPKIGGPKVVAVAAGLWHRLALRADGTVVAWGKTLSAQCADGVSSRGCEEEPTNRYPLGATLDRGDTAEGLTSRWAPVCPALFRAGAVRSIAAGGYRSLALFNDGTVLGWGDPIGYPLPSAPQGDPRRDPPVPVDLVGMRCVNGLAGIRILNPTVPVVAMGEGVGDGVDLELEIDKARDSQVPVGIALLDAEANGVSAEFKFATGSAYSTRETRGTMRLRVATPGGRVILPTGFRTLRLLARSGDIAVETSFTINVVPPIRLVPVP